MLVAQRPIQTSVSCRRAAGLLSAVVAVAMAGCSANIARLDAPASFALNDGPRARQNVGGPVPQATPEPSGTAYGSAQRGPQPVDMAALPPLSDPAAPRAMAVTRAPAPGQATAPASQPMAAPANVPARGQQIEVQRGDTLYGIAKKHRVMISELMAANELKNPNLKPGQKLYLPTGSRAAAAAVKPVQRATTPIAPVASQAAPAAEPVVAAPDASADDESYTVKGGDSLYAIASRHKVKVADLQRANGITDARRVKPGMVLKIPRAGAAGTIATPPSASESGEPRIVRSGGPVGAEPATTAGTTSGLRVLNGEGARQQVASVESTTRNDASAAVAPAPAAAAAGKLRWPVKGRVVQGFGPRADGSHNDGVDIAVPAGTDVLAADAGVVAYVGDEVKAYGNLVLIRHDNGWVTAYAHNEKLLVGRGDRVKRGQAIAKAGTSGSGGQPQVHFEVRVGSKPVDPVGYLDRM